jgi:hypothetical protein
VAYLDNPDTCVKVFPMCFPSLGQRLYPGDDGLKLDMYHAFTRLRETFSSSNHPSGQPAIQDLSNRCVAATVGSKARYLVASNVCCSTTASSKALGWSSSP